MSDIWQTHNQSVPWTAMDATMQKYQFLTLAAASNLSESHPGAIPRRSHMKKKLLVQGR